MADTAQSAWPRTPDGTTDWEYVFEDPSSGFIPLISQVQSPEALTMGATVVLEKLFTRKNDVDERTLLIAQLNRITGTEKSIEDKIAYVAKLMRGVKDERMRKARDYVARKKAGAAIDRRSGLLWKLNKVLEPRILIPVGLLFVMAISGLVYIMLQSTLGPKTEAEIAAKQAAIEAEQAADTAAAEAEQAAIDLAAEPLPIWFKTLRWPLATKYTKDKPKYYSVTLFVRNWDDKIEVCRRLPTVTDRFYLSFSNVMPLSRAARDAEIIALQDEIKGSINAILPKDAVTSVEVARYGTKAFRAATRAPYCKSPNRPKP